METSEQGGPAAETPPRAVLIAELEKLASEIRKVRSDLASIGPGSIRNQHISTAADHLDAVVEATETAANQIMDSCDALEGVAAEVGGEPAQRIRDAVTTIYEACGFQDLTSQRIVNVSNTLGFIETKLGDVMKTLGITIDDLAEEQAAAAARAAAEAGDKALLNGPQLPGAAIDQSEIDRLLADMG